MTFFKRLPGVLPNTYRAPMRPRLMVDPILPAAYSRILGTPITLGENDVHGDCVAVAAWNATFCANARRGVFTSCQDSAPFDLYCTLGGMPADEGLDPATLFNYWQSTPINGWLLKSIEEIALDDTAGMEQTIIDNGFVYFTATLDEAQMDQQDWTPVDSPVAGGHATILSWWEAGWFYDETWGAERRASPAFIKAQGQNVWRLDLELAT